MIAVIFLQSFYLIYEKNYIDFFLEYQNKSRRFKMFQNDIKKKY